MNEEDLKTYLDTMVVAPTEGEEERLPTALEMSKVKRFLRLLRESFLTLSKPAPSLVPSGKAALPAKLVIEVPDTSSKLKLQDYLDQSLGGVV